MYKITTIILLIVSFASFNWQASAQNPDIDILKSINNNSSPAFREYSKVISNTTTGVSFATPLVMGAIGFIEKDDDLLKSALYVGVTIGVNAAMTYSLKQAINRPRPYVTYPDLLTPYKNEVSPSFPSGHTSIAFATATALTLKYPKWYVIVPSYVWACSVGYSRMNLGVHYPSDVLAGALLGAGSAYATLLINNWFWKNQNKKKLITLHNFSY